MTVQTVPFALQNASHSAALFRQSASAPFVSGGILAAGELTITQQATPNMSVVLGAGRAKVPGTSVSPPSGLSFTTQGMYDVLNDAPVTLTVAAADATNPRIDVPYIQVQDSFYSGAANQAIAGIVTGTPAPTPFAPAVPSNAVGLAPIAVAANATSIVGANIGAQATLAALIQARTSITAVLTRATNFTLTTSVQAIPFDSAPILNGLTWVVGSPTRITCVTAGNYLLTGDWQANSTGTATFGIRKNGTVIGGEVIVTNASGACIIPAAFGVELAVGDYVEVVVFISTGTQPWIAANRVNVGLLSYR